MHHADAPQVPPSPAELIGQLIEAATQRGLTVKQTGNAILNFSRPPEYSSEESPADLDRARLLFSGLSQMVVLVRDKEAPQPEGGPPVLAWYWWWQGDRLAGESRADEMERLTSAADVDVAADRIANVLRVDSPTG
ncbi:hypothetical protein [Streptosporangium sp. CA-115845]|uniref:hypothetical protein n=1 Tax=Streptosporangium sp. CA-115845 TaxID=3240071 RepID=UPI003D8ACDF6